MRSAKMKVLWNSVYYTKFWTSIGWHEHQVRVTNSWLSIDVDNGFPMWVNDDVIKWKHFPRNWPFVRGIHRSPVNSPHKSQWRGALIFSLICTRINGWVNNGEAGDLRRYLSCSLWRHGNGAALWLGRFDKNSWRWKNHVPSVVIFPYFSTFHLKFNSDALVSNKVPRTHNSHPTPHKTPFPLPSLWKSGSYISQHFAMKPYFL